MRRATFVPFTGDTSCPRAARAGGGFVQNKPPHGNAKVHPVGKHYEISIRLSLELFHQWLSVYVRGKNKQRVGEKPSINWPCICPRCNFQPKMWLNAVLQWSELQTAHFLGFPFSLWSVASFLHDLKGFLLQNKMLKDGSRPLPVMCFFFVCLWLIHRLESLIAI